MMDMESLRKSARERLKPFCRVCPVCDGVACAGEVPGMGGVGTGKGFMENIDSLARVKLNMRTLHDAKDPDIHMKYLKKSLSMPILPAPITGSKYNMGGGLPEVDYAKAVVDGALASGTLAMTGDGGDPLLYDAGLDAIKSQDGMGIPIIKPRENSVIIELVDRARALQVPAVGMDVDGAGLVTMAFMGQPVGPKTATELREIIKTSGLPFILKGIMTPDEADLALEVGASAIVVSNHGGRVLDYTPGVAEVLPGIAKKVKGRLTIFADGGVRKGVDVLKYLALGADAVLVGRPIIFGAFGDGYRGVKLILDTLAKELKQAMILTGCEDLDHVDEGILFNG